MKKIKLDPLASIALEWSRKAYSQEIVNNFLGLADISSGSKLNDKCKSVCEWYDEIVTNEIYFAKEFIEGQLHSIDKKQLVIILGARKSLIAMELLRKYPEKVDRIIEIDNQWMAAKEEFYNTFYPGVSEKIKCLTAELTSSELLSSINFLLHEYYNNSPCLVLLNNISEFMSANELDKIISSFKSEKKNNTIIVDYAVPPDSISPEFRNIPLNIYDLIRSESRLDSISHYSSREINKLFRKNGGKLVKNISMKEMEFRRTGINKHFRKDADGWIKCSVWKL